MDTYFRVIAGVLIAVILGLALQKESRDMALLLSMAACCGVFLAGAEYLAPVVSLLKKLGDIAAVDMQWITVVLKAAGISMIAQIATLICNDSGNSAMGKGIQLLSGAAVLWVSIPMINALIELIQRLLGEL